MASREQNPGSEEAGGIDRSIFFEVDSDPVIRSGDATQMANRPGVIRALDYIVRHAIQLRASDIHFEPCSISYQIRYRIDGELRELPQTPQRVGQALVSRIKILSGMDISKRRVPQDGRFLTKTEGREVEFRVSSLPGVFGEGVVLRILNRSALKLDLDAVGMEKAVQLRFEDCVGRANGIVLLTGPTGSGKTTTLYGAITGLNKVDVKIITAEEPVEYDMGGVMQVEIDDKVGLSFARSLRAMLRQDPDIILIGEIRDPETAKIAVESAMTGHLVLSTLHTRDAPSAIARLIDLGVEPYLVSDTLVGVMAQRLVRKVCEYCKQKDETFHLPEGMPASVFAPGNFQRGAGCAECGRTGFRGRTGLFELMTMNPEIRDLIERNAAADEIREAAKRGGMETLRSYGFRKVGEGLTSLKEVWAATPDAL